MKPRVLFVGRTRYRLPLSPSLARKFDALAEEVDLRVLASAAPGSPIGDGTFTLVPPLQPHVLDGIAFWLALPFRVSRVLRAFRPQAVVCQTAYDAAATLVARRIARLPARVVVEVHGDWRTSTRLYGSSARRLVSGIADRLAAAALRRADAVRTVSPFTTGLVRELGVEPNDEFPAFMELEPFVVEPAPLPEQPVALFVGVLEAYKNIDGLARAWKLAASQVPAASLRLVGNGTRADIAEALARDGAPLGRRAHTRRGGAGARRRVGARAPVALGGHGPCARRGVLPRARRDRYARGSIPDLVTDGVSGLLVPPGDDEALADAIVGVLSDRALAERLAAGARDAAAPWLQTPEEYAHRMRELVVA